MTTESTKPYEGKTCFVITPIGGENSEVRREADGIIDEVLEPVLGGIFGFRVEVAHKTYSTGSITDKVIQSVVESELAICNLATLNPNVMYELALRHAARKPVVTIAPKGTNLPFDINDDRVIFYENDIAGSYQLKKDLPLMIKAAMEEETPNNPVYRALRSEKLMQEVQVGGGADAALLEIITGLSTKVDNLQRSIGGPGLRKAMSENTSGLDVSDVTAFKLSGESISTNEASNLKEFLNNLPNLAGFNYRVLFSINEKTIGIDLVNNNGMRVPKDFSYVRAKKSIIKAVQEHGYQTL